MEFPSQDSLVCGFSLQALSDGCVFTGGSFSCPDSVTLMPVNLALNICTYHREAFIKRTLSNLEQNIFSSPESPLHGHLYVYITDNGQTLDPVDIQRKEIRLNRQNGFGSAGGFARGQLSILADRGTYNLTHMVFMDDDILFDTDVLCRTFWFLSLLREEYQGYILGGALLCLHTPWLQVETGAHWGNGNIQGINSGLMLTHLDEILRNELEERPDYQGWWYCCVPVAAAQTLPLPVYFHRDDVEFGLRQKGYVYLNGICVWHEEFENKPSSSNVYYDTRNRLIVNAIHCPCYERRAAIRDTFRDVMKKIVAYRYREAALILEGVQDFCLGVDWVLSHDSQEHHSKLIEKGYRGDKLSSPLDFSAFETCLNSANPASRISKMLQVGLGILLPAYKTAVVPVYLPSSHFFYRAKNAINYNSADETAYITQKSLKESLRIAMLFLKACLKLWLHFDKVASQWNAQVTALTTEEFWRTKLNCGNQSDYFE